MIRYLYRASLARFREGKTLFALSLFGVAIGVGSVLSIQIINQNALSAFQGSMKAVTGDADLSVVGRTPSLDGSTLPEVLGTRGVTSAWPICRFLAAAARGDSGPELFLEVIGADLFTPAVFPPLESSGSEPGTETNGVSVLEEAITVPGWVAVSPSLAAEMGWGIGDTVPVSVGARRVDLTVGALVDFSRYSPLASRKLALMDIAQAHHVLGSSGEISEIQVRIADGVDGDEMAAALQKKLGEGVLVLTPEAREAKVKGLLGAFRLNLTALSLISLFVGLFLIYSSTQNSLVRRRPEFGLLRSLGATRAQILGLILSEILTLGILGTALGILLGYLAAMISVEKVSATLTSIYLLGEIERLELDRGLFVVAAGVGIGGALLAGILPALDIGRRDTRSLLVSFTLRETVSRLAPRLAVVGTLSLAGTALWYLIEGREIQSGGFVLAFALLVSLTFFTPVLILVLCRPLRPGGFGLAYSLKTLALKVQKTAFAVASLGVAVSMLVAVTLLVGSFRQTLVTWLKTSIVADVYITTETWARQGRLATMDDELLADLQSRSGVTGSEVLRQLHVYSGDRQIALAGVRFDRESRSETLPLYRGDPAAVWRGLDHGGALVGEPLSRKMGLAVGDSLIVAAGSGPVSFPIVGITYDYSETGSALITLDTMESAFGPAPINNVALFVDSGQDLDRFIDGLRDRFSGYPLLIRSNRELRAEVMRLFDQTFAITRLLQLMALLVASSGVSLTLLVLARERISELALYRALGALPRQIFRIFLGEGIAIGVLGLLLGLGGGIVLAAILIYIINPAYFGWTIRPSWPWLEVMQEVTTILVAAALSGVYPALRASRMSVRELSRDDL